MAVREVGPAIRVVQPNLSQAEQHDRNFDEDSVVRLERLTGPPSATPRLILWPEAAVPYYLDEESWVRYRLSKLLGPRDLLLTGGTTLIYNKAGGLDAARNSLFAMNPASDLIGRYDKAHLVPYGEYLPMRPLLSAIGLSKLVQSDVDFVPGAGPSTMTLPGFGKVGVQICYEIIFSGQVVDAAHRPDFIFNPSTDAWFGAWGPPQHLAQARLRAIEEGLPVIRATPTGISAVIDADGHLLAALPLNKPGVITSHLPSPNPATLFATYGNSIPLMLALLLAIAAVAPRFRRR
jgi:apolipoprotein N-acyltransferase